MAVVVKDSTPAGGEGVFRTTRWSVVLRAADGNAPEAQAALAQLYQNYSYPLYAYLRRQGQDAESAQDLVQELFVAIMEKQQLASVVPEKGRFRSYLMAAANHLLANEWNKARRVKRGGGQAPISLDSLEVEERYRLEPVDSATPEALYDRRWALALLDTVMQRLRKEWENAGKTDAFAALKCFLSGEDETPSYLEVGKRLNLSESAARVTVHRLRQRYRELLRDEIIQTVDCPGDIEAELRDLLAALRGN